MTAADEAFRDRTAAVELQIGTDAGCWADFNNDGWVDLCVSGSVWLNRQGQRFEKLAEVGTAVAADFDNDGWLDLFSWSTLRLYRNVAGQRFVEVPLPRLPETVSRGACWGDFNGDGFVDLFVGGYEDWDRGITWPSLLLLNDAGQSLRLSWSDSQYRARGVTACDFDQDGDLDVYVSNYRLQPNRLWRNDGKARFQDAAAELNLLATSPGFEGGHSIGAVWGDFDNDGRFDLFAGNFAHQDNRGDQPKSRFLKNRGPEAGWKFDDRGPCGVFYQESYATPSAGDYDNDGRLDLFFTTVYGTASFGRPNAPVLFRNTGDFQFADVTQEMGLAGQPPTYQAAWADFDRDGDLDLLAGGKLWVNQGNAGHWLQVSLRGDGKSVNRAAIGAQVRVRIGDRVLSRQVEAGTGEGNQNDLTLHFGLGAHAGPVQLEIVWPGGQRQTVSQVALQQTVIVKFQPDSAPAR
ncbi:MAG: CRTAC1 family protein [Planctomycetes bacterium]|nr:CRTAC1 family protein [Planctomycetota bacterium]